MANTIISNHDMKKDEDLPAVMKKKSRNPKPRDKWSLLWFIPSQVLNSRDDITDAKGRFVKRGKRLGFDRFNQLNCKVCRKVFHKYQTLTFHSHDVHGGRTNPSPVLSRSPSFQPAAIKRIQPDPIRRSNRVTSLKPVSYDDDIEILEIDVSPSKPKEMGEQKFGKLSLSAQRKLVEEHSKGETKIKEAGPSIKIKHIVKEEPKKKIAIPTIRSKLQITKVPAQTKPKIPAKEIEVIDIDMDDDDEQKASAVNVEKRNVASNISKKDEEILLTRDNDIEEKEHTRKRKLSNMDTTQTEKKLKSMVESEKQDLKEVKSTSGKSDETQTEKNLKTTAENEKSDLIEVKSSSGKSMFVNKAALEKIMASKSLQAAVANKKVPAPSNVEKTDSKPKQVVDDTHKKVVVDDTHKKEVVDDANKTEPVDDTNKGDSVDGIEMSEDNSKTNTITTKIKLSPVGRKMTRNSGI